MGFGVSFDIYVEGEMIDFIFLFDFGVNGVFGFVIVLGCDLFNNDILFWVLGSVLLMVFGSLGSFDMDEVLVDSFIILVKFFM